jgi:hypothetical protein
MTKTKADCLIIKAPEWYTRPDFLAWLNRATDPDVTSFPAGRDGLRSSLDSESTVGAAAVPQPNIHQRSNDETHHDHGIR